MLTTFELDEYVFDALRYGASGFLIKDTTPADLLRAIRLVAAGDALLSPSVTRRVVREFATRPTRRLTPHRQLSTLTDREREITGLVGEGLSNDEIGLRLQVSPATARTHVSRAMVKLGARDRAQLVVFAYQSGLVEPSRPTSARVGRRRSATSTVDEPGRSPGGRPGGARPGHDGEG